MRRTSRRAPERELRLPAEPIRVLQRLGRLFRGCEDGEDVRAGHAQARDLRLNVGRADVVALGRDELHLRAQDAAPEAGEKLLPIAAVLVEDADPGRALRAREVLAEHPPLGGEGGPEADRVRVLGGLGAERRRAGGGEELRHLLLVEVVADGEVLVGAERVEDREDPVLLDEPLRQLGGLRRVGEVVQDRVVDPAAVDATLRVDVVEVRLRGARDGRVPGLRARHRRRAAEEDGRRRDARVARRPGRRGERGGRAERERDHEREQREKELSCHRVEVLARRVPAAFARSRSDGRCDVLGV